MSAKIKRQRADEDSESVSDAHSLNREDRRQDAYSSDSEPSQADSAVQNQLRTVTFDALLQAQDDLERSTKSRRKRARHADDAADKLQTLRDRLAELREANGSSRKDRKPRDADHEARVSKHAPTEQSSKHQVSRKRAVVDISTSSFRGRDPRFSAVSGGLDDETIMKKYSFLEDYRKQELDELKSALKKAKTDDDKGRLRKEIMSRENRQKAEDGKERQKKILREHRKREKDLVAQGKKPFFMKRSEQKKQALVDKFEGMKGKERDKAIRKKRKKESEKERRAMPADRRQRA